MLNANARKWVAALRSGKFRQGEGHLHQKPRDDSQGDLFCCLGVACYLAVQDGVPVAVKENGSFFYDDKGGTLPGSVARWLGFADDRNMYGRCWPDEKRTSLAEKNDSNVPFDEIADIIESDPKGLFRS